MVPQVRGVAPVGMLEYWKSGIMGSGLRFVAYASESQVRDDRLCLRSNLFIGFRFQVSDQPLAAERPV